MIYELRIKLEADNKEQARLQALRLLKDTRAKTNELIQKDKKELDLKELLKKSGITQQMIALKFNRSRQVVNKWFRGAHKPNAFVIKGLAEMLGLSMEDLVEKFEMSKK